MIDLSLLADGGMAWLEGSGPEPLIVLSTRIRLARNLADRTFPPHARDADREAVAEQVVTAARASRVLSGASVLAVDGLDPVDRQLLHERHLVSKELAGLEGAPTARPHAMLVVQGDVGLMVNEEDHLRLQTLRSGLALEAAYGAIEALDKELGEQLPFAFHPEFGYLTSCPTNAGTGLRASVLIHLPGLVLTKEMGRVLHGMSQVGLTARGLYGEGSEIVGNFFQLSNQTTLGKSEDELLDHLGRIVRQVIAYEEQARGVLGREAPTVIADKVWRAYGLLRFARSLSFTEAMNLLSAVRLGVGLKLIQGLSVYTLNKLLVFTQPAHLGRAEGLSMTDPQLPVARAAYVRRLLEAEPVG